MAHQPKRPRVTRTARQRPDDLTLAVIAREVDAVDIPPELQRQINARFAELVNEAAARRPAPRPRTDMAGELVDNFSNITRMTQAAARQRPARWLKRPLASVARAHTRYRLREQQDKSAR